MLDRPTTAQVRAGYIGRTTGSVFDAEAEFERWLAQHDTEVTAAAISQAAVALRAAPTDDPGTKWANNDIADWLDARAAAIREGKTDA